MAKVQLTLGELMASYAKGAISKTELSFHILNCAKSADDVEKIMAQWHTELATELNTWVHDIPFGSLFLTTSAGRTYMRPEAEEAIKEYKARRFQFLFSPHCTDKYDKRTLQRGDVVIAVEHLDPNGADVRPGTIGIVFEEAGCYGNPHAGPMVRWMNMGVCNVYPGQAEYGAGLDLRLFRMK